MVLAIAENFQFCSDLVMICANVERIGRTYIFFLNIRKKLRSIREYIRYFWLENIFQIGARWFKPKLVILYITWRFCIKLHFTSTFYDWW